MAAKATLAIKGIVTIPQPETGEVESEKGGNSLNKSSADNSRRSRSTKGYTHFKCDGLGEPSLRIDGHEGWIGGARQCGAIQIC